LGEGSFLVTPKKSFDGKSHKLSDLGRAGEKDKKKLLTVEAGCDLM
jgi:hypothetical protein